MTAAAHIRGRYDPRVFDVRDMASARHIILTPEDRRSTDQRWGLETAHLLKLMRGLRLKESSLVLDYGCGVGRLSGPLIERTGCRVIGCDISPTMRALANDSVKSPRFMTCAPEFLEALPVKVDAAIAVWVLQHCREPAEDVRRIVSMLKPDGRLFVLNERYRCVPTEQGWVDDKRDVFKLIEAEGLSVETECKLDAKAVGPRIAKYALARIYRATFKAPGQ